MRSWEVTTEINAPIQVVWDNLTDFNSQADWNPNVTSSVIRTIKTYGKGTIIVIKREWQQYVLTINEVRVDTFLAIDFTGDGIKGRSEYYLEEKDKGTLLRHLYILDLKERNKILKIFTKKRLESELAALKKWIETKRANHII